MKVKLKRPHFAKNATRYKAGAIIDVDMAKKDLPEWMEPVATAKPAPRKPANGGQGGKGKQDAKGKEPEAPAEPGPDEGQTEAKDEG